MEQRWRYGDAAPVMSYDKAAKPQKRHKTGFRGPSPDVGKATQFQPGQPSANPGGRPSKSLMQQARERIANDPKFVAEWEKATKKRMLTGSMVGFFEGRENQDRVDGPVKQELELSGTVGLAEGISKARKRAEE